MVTQDRLSTRLAIAVTRLVMIVLAGGLGYIGFTLLTTPWAIPVTIALWIGGLIIAALGLRGELPHDA